MNQVVGITYAVILYYFVFDFSVVEGLSTTAFFSVAGLTRVYCIRRFVEWRQRRKHGQNA
jgi:hypothetical protein